MRFSYDWLKELSGTSLSASEAAELLSAKAFEVEGIDGDVMEIKILPNRPDCLSHLGIARELCALEGRRFAAPSFEYRTGSHPSVTVTVQDDGCRRFSALIVRGVQVGPSPKWVVARLEACGLRSINNVVDVTNLVMLELGEPMHAFDLRKVDRIVVRRAREGEEIAALDEARTRYQLTPEMLVVADGERAQSIAGIKGGADSGIADDTTDVLLEAACWDPVTIRATGRALGLRTDASIRFSYGVDPSITVPALLRAAELLAKVAGARRDGDIIDVYPHPVPPLQLVLRTDYVRSLGGVPLDDDRIRGVLESLGFEAEAHAHGLLVTVPTRRLDVTSPEDLVEEVVRLYGYDAVPSEAPLFASFQAPAAAAEDDAGVAWDEWSFIRERFAIAHLLVGAGFTEVYSYSFNSDEQKRLLKMETLPELELPQSGEYRWLRSSLVPRLLSAAVDNLRFFDDVHLFETGHVFDRVGQGRESARLALADAHRSRDGEPFYVLKGAVDLLLERLGITDAYYDDAEPIVWEPGAVNASVGGRRALIRLEGSGTVVGFIGAVSSRVADAYKLKGSAAIAELDLQSLIHHAQREREFAPIPKHPAITRDIAVLVEQDVKIDDILQTAQDAGGALVEDVDVFDIFVPTGKEKLKAEGDTPEYGKSVAFHVIFRAADRTLRDDEVAKAEEAIKSALQEKLGAQIR
jgi:phenylalanyl-tRNA synthetase beta chain